MESQIQLLIYLVPACAALALIVAYALAKWISNVDSGNERMKEISGYIHEGAMAFLKREDNGFRNSSIIFTNRYRNWKLDNSSYVFDRSTIIRTCRIFRYGCCYKGKC